MSTTTQLREALELRSESFDISVDSFDDIAGAAGRRTRRSRLAVGATVMAFVMVMFAGLSGLDRSEPSSAMFASLSDDLIDAPSQVIKTDDGWLGVAIWGEPIDENEPIDFRWEFEGQVFVATSDDGEEWKLADPTGLRTNSTYMAIDEHDGTYWLALSGADGPYVASSSDLEEWITVALPVSQEAADVKLVEGMQRSVQPQSIVANDSGIMVLVEYFDHPDIDALGGDASTTCGMNWSSQQVSARTCGTTDWQRFDIDLDMGPGYARPYQLAFSDSGTNFENVALPTTAAFSGPQQPRLFKNGDSFGFVDNRLYTTDGNEEWEQVEGVLVSRPAVAAERDGELVVANSRLGTSTDIVLRLNDGETIGTDLSDILGPIVRNERGTNRVLNVRGVSAGEAGWLIHGHISTWSTSAAPFGEAEEPFTAQVKNGTISGVTPGGAASLTDEEGAVVYEWETFEAIMPERTAARFDEGDYVFRDDQGNDIARVAIEDWQSQLDLPGGTPEPVALFSADGVTWTDLDLEFDHIASAAIGEDEVVIVHYGPFGPTASVIEVGDEAD